MRLLYAPLVSDRELRIDAGRACWCRKGRRKEESEVSVEGGLDDGGKSINRGGILAQLMIEYLSSI